MFLHLNHDAHMMDILALILSHSLRPPSLIFIFQIFNAGADIIFSSPTCRLLMNLFMRQ